MYWLDAEPRAQLSPTKASPFSLSFLTLHSMDDGACYDHIQIIFSSIAVVTFVPLFNRFGNMSNMFNCGVCCWPLHGPNMKFHFVNKTIVLQLQRRGHLLSPIVNSLLHQSLAFIYYTIANGSNIKYIDSFLLALIHHTPSTTPILGFASYFHLSTPRYISPHLSTTTTTSIIPHG